MPLDDILAMTPPDPEAEERRAESRRMCLDQVEHVRARLQVAPDSVTDRELLDCINCLFHDVYSHTPFEADYDQLIEALSFTRRPLDDLEGASLKRAWTNFLEESEADLGFPLYEGLAWWYLREDKTAHAIAVLEHLRKMILGGQLGEHEEAYEGWLMGLFHACVQHNLIARARYVAELIGDYHEAGLVSPSGYAEILSQQSGLRYPEFGQAIEEDRVEVERRLRSDCGPLFQSLHATTRSLVIDAELWSKANLREIEPAAGPRRWALAVEAEFNAKVFQPNRNQLESALREGSPEGRLRHGQSCSVGQIDRLIRISRRGDMAGATVCAVFDRLLGGHELRAGGELNIPRILLDHRDQIAHVTDRGLYTRTNCDEFLRVGRESGWVFRFLEAIQPR